MNDLTSFMLKYGISYNTPIRISSINKSLFSNINCKGEERKILSIFEAKFSRHPMWISIKKGKEEGIIEVFCINESSTKIVDSQLLLGKKDILGDYRAQRQHIRQGFTQSFDMKKPDERNAFLNYIASFDMSFFNNDPIHLDTNQFEACFFQNISAFEKNPQLVHTLQIQSSYITKLIDSKNVNDDIVDSHSLLTRENPKNFHGRNFSKKTLDRYFHCQQYHEGASKDKNLSMLEQYNHKKISNMMNFAKEYNDKKSITFPGFPFP